MIITDYGGSLLKRLDKFVEFDIINNEILIKNQAVGKGGREWLKRYSCRSSFLFLFFWLAVVL